MIMHRLPRIHVALALSALLAGCAESDLPSYQRNEAGVSMRVERVQITGIRPVVIKEGTTGIGAVSGGLAGGIAGSMIGHGKASGLAAVGGAVGGLLLGNQAEKRLNKTNGLEITYRRNDGRESVLVQRDNGEDFANGQMVRLISGPRSSRIER